MADAHHGVRVVEISDGAHPLPLITPLVGMICVAEDHAATFPLNTPVLLTFSWRNLRDRRLLMSPGFSVVILRDQTGGKIHGDKRCY